MEATIEYKVSVIIVTFNSSASLPSCLTNLAISLRGIAYELIVVDNGSSDDSVSIVKNHISDAIVLESDRNAGFAAACNRAAAVARGDYLLFHNPDLQLDQDAIRYLLEASAGHKDAGALAGRMRFPDGSFQATCRNFPTMSNMFFSRGSVFSRMLYQTGETYTLSDSGETIEVPAVAGTLLLIRREVFDAMGRFDERFFMYMEDTDLCLRLKKAGYENYYVPSAGGVHLWGKGSSGGKLRRSYYHHRSVWKYFLKHFPGVMSLVILPIGLLVNFAVAAIMPERSKKK